MAKTHGLSHVPEFRVWSVMKSRCLNPNRKDHKWYKHIQICEEWLNFENFYRSMGPRPSPKHELDRIDNALGYNENNCRWVDHKTNCRNKRNCIRVLWEGVDYNFTELCALLKVLGPSVYATKHRYGCSLLHAIKWVYLKIYHTKRAECRAGLTPQKLFCTG